jgi:hypothetical protein
MSPWDELSWIVLQQDEIATRVKFDTAFSQYPLHWRQWLGPWIGPSWSLGVCIDKKCGLFEKVGTMAIPLLGRFLTTFVFSAALRVDWGAFRCCSVFESRSYPLQMYCEF